jgi:iron complex outermembrane receptor protein
MSKNNLAGLLCGLLLTGMACGQDSGPASKQDLTGLTLEQLGKVKITSASLHDESLEDAPASVTVITAEEIRKFGCRSLADALSYVRGFFTYSDHTYTYLGVRGFALPADFNARIIVMINGHQTADNVYDQPSGFGNDFPLDLDLVERIEVLRGPSSALYGSNGILATINVITRKPADTHGSAVRFETDSLGERKAVASTAVALPKGANLLFSTSVFNNAGAHELYFSEFDAPQTNFGRAIDMDGEKGYQVFADLTWRNWELLAVAADRVKQQPVSWGDMVWNDRGTRAEDSRAFVDLAYTRDLPGDRTLSWRTYYDAYRYRGIYRYAAEGAPRWVEDNREQDYGDWVGSRFTYRLPDFAGGYITAGAEVRADLRAEQHVFDVTPYRAEILRINQPDRYAAIFAQQEWKLGTHWSLNTGARLDWCRLKSNAISPRVAAIYKPAPKTDLKILYSRGFLNPSNYDMFFSDGLTQIANPSLRPETADSYEIDFDREITPRLRIGTSIYHYRVSGLIEQTYAPDGLAQFVNLDRVRASGAAVEIAWRLPAGMELASSLALQRAVLRQGVALPNSPGQLAKLRFSMPLWHDKLTLGAGIQTVGRRNTYAGATLPWVLLPEVVVSTRPLVRGLQMSAGIKNVSNSFYRDPAGLTPVVDSIIGNGRTYYLSVGWRSASESGR